MLGKLPVPGRPTIWITVGQGLAVDAGGGCLEIFTLIDPFFPFSPARYSMKYCLKGPLNHNQPTNQSPTPTPTPKKMFFFFFFFFFRFGFLVRKNLLTLAL